MLEHAGAEHLHLKRGGALIGVFERDDLALFGHAQASADGARRLRRDRLRRRRAAPAHRTAATMEKGDGDAGLGADLSQFRLRFRKLPVRRQEAAVLIRVGIADHDFLRAALHARAAPDERQRQQFAHDRGRRAQIGNCLEQRRDRQHAGLDARCVVIEIGFLGEEIGAEDIGDRAGHAQNERAEGFAIEFFALVARQPEHAERFLGLGRQLAANRRSAAGAAELSEQPGFPFVRNHAPAVRLPRPDAWRATKLAVFG